MKSTFSDWYERKMYATSELSDETNDIQSLLGKVNNIAIVGISKNETKDSHFVGRYLKNAGYRIFPVNPTASEILGETCYPDLQSIPESIDVVDIFRRPEDIPAIVEEALSIHPKAIWLQLGTGEHHELKSEVEQKGIKFIQKRCIKADHQFLIRS